MLWRGGRAAAREASCGVSDLPCLRGGAVVFRRVVCVCPRCVSTGGVAGACVRRGEKFRSLLTRAEPMSRLTPLRAAPTRTRSSYTTSLGIRGTDAGLIKFGRQPSSQPHQPSLPTFAHANPACDHRCASTHLLTTRSCDTALAAPWQSPTLTCLETGYARGVGGDGLPGASPLRASVLYACQRSRLRSMRRFTPRGPRPPRD